MDLKTNVFFLFTKSLHYLERLLISALDGNDRGPYSKKITLSAVDYTFVEKRLWNFQRIFLKMDVKFGLSDLKYL